MKPDWINDWYSLGMTANVAPGSVICKRVGEVELALFNVNGDFIARANICGGCGQPLSEGRIKKSELECAGCRLRIQIAQQSDPSAAAIFPVMVVDDEIFAWIENLAESSQS